jgi:hypothetical protein
MTVVSIGVMLVWRDFHRLSNQEQSNLVPLCIAWILEHQEYIGHV